MGFQQGLSGLNAASKNLDVIGNNVSNANTVGFKGAQAQFADVYASSLAGAGVPQIGIGVKVTTVAQQFTQGNISVTNNSLDMAVSGEGFFRMSNNGAITYSRNGQFQLDKNGFIVNSKGLQLTGFVPNALGQIIATAPTPLQVSSADLLPRQTSAIVAGVNLDARATIIPAAPAFNPTNPATFNNSTSMTVYDSLGGSHVASLYFAMTAPNNWNTYLTVDGALVPPGSGLLSAMTFNTNGTLATPAAPVTTPSFTPTPAAITLAGASTTALSTSVTVPSTTGLSVGASVTGTGIPAGATIATITPPNAITLSVAATATAAGVSLTATNPANAAAQTLSFNFSGTSQFGSTFGVNSLTQDGYTSGHMNGFSTGADGVISGRYSNGQSKTIGQVVLSNFINQQGLQSLGGNNWAETSISGAPLTGVPGSATLGVLQTSAVEDSNVDLTAELVNMITAQRVYQANAQTIKTQDAVLQTLVNLR